MSVKPTEPGGGSASRVQVKSSESQKSEYSQAIDLLANWILEDSNAVANAFDVDLANVLEDALRRAQSETVFFSEQGSRLGRIPTAGSYSS